MQPQTFYDHPMQFGRLADQAGAALTQPAAAPRGGHGWFRGGAASALLRVPLVGKLLGANLLLIFFVTAITVWRHWLLGDTAQGIAILVVALLLAGLMNAALVLLALEPLRALERVSARVAHGDLDAEVIPSVLSDEQLTRVSSTLNMLVARLRADRRRSRELASMVIRAQDEERSRIARELHDSTAQTMAAVQLQLSAITRELATAQPEQEELRERLAELRDMAESALEELRLLSHTVYPRILDDLGLAAALEWLARRAREQDSVDIELRIRGESRPPREQAAALYRIAQEAVRNAVRHADASYVQLRLTLSSDSATLEVADDGRGFDVDAAESRRPGMGLFSMRERVLLVNGLFTVESAPTRGTLVRATVPMEREDNER